MARKSEGKVSTLHSREWTRLAGRERLLLGCAAMGFIVVFSVAFWLEPDPRGHGTHEQMGLLPCATSFLLGIPCPFCGMTTSFSLMAHGRPFLAFQTQAAGAVLFVACVVAFLASVAGFATGRFPPLVHYSTVGRWFWKVGLAILILSWVYKMMSSAH